MRKLVPAAFDGGPDAVAEEIAREAGLDSTLVVLLGTQLGAWSNEIGDDRLTELVADARANDPGASDARCSSLRSIQAEPVGDGVPWARIGSRLPVLALGGLVSFDRLVRRRP